VSTRKLVEYDQETWAQPSRMFLCHSGDREHTVCKGWLACHKDSLLAYRLAVREGKLDPQLSDFTSPVDLHQSGSEAARAEMTSITNPPPAARRVIETILRRRFGSESESS